MGQSTPLNRQGAILVVEDDLLIRFTASELLADEGFAVVTADNADEALSVLAGRRDIFMVFTDVNMPGQMNGIELAREVHARWPKVMLLVTSGREVLSDQEIPDDGRFMPKPYGAAALRQSVRALIDAH
jgi:CheY-like chemotaxis protein